MNLVNWVTCLILVTLVIFSELSDLGDFVEFGDWVTCVILVNLVNWAILVNWVT